MEINGTIDKWGCPIFKCDIANTDAFQKTTVTAVIDTGAYNYYLKQIYIDALQLPVIDETEMNHPTEGKKMIFKYKGAIILGDWILCDLIIQPIILQSYEHDFIIGTEFLHLKNFVYGGGSNEWKISW